MQLKDRNEALIYLAQNVSIDRETKCYRWKGAKTKKGYSLINVDGKMTTVSRLMLELVTETELLPEVQACHSCDTRDCINPDHLWPGTWKDNLKDAVQKGRLDESCNLVKGLVG